MRLTLRFTLDYVVRKGNAKHENTNSLRREGIQCLYKRGHTKECTNFTRESAHQEVILQFLSR